MTRISADLATAQLASVRETGLKVALVRDRTNDWEYVAGASINPAIYVSQNGNFKEKDIEYYKYRAGAAICVLSNNNIVRVRNGDPSDLTDRKIYVQEITDPTIASQWTTWSVLYSGDHYGRPEIMANGTSYVVYHAKSGGLYRNNTKKWEPSEGSQWKAFGWYPVRNELDAGWMINQADDFVDGERRIHHDFTDDLNSPTYQENDRSNFRRYQSAIAGWKVGSEVHRVQFGPLYTDARAKYKDSIWHQIQTSLTDGTLSPPQLLRGLGGAGLMSFDGVFLYQFSDGYYYLFTGEVHEQLIDDVQVASNNLNGLLPTWSRSKDLINWSQPVIGPPADGIRQMAGVVERSGYLYWADNGQVWRRPLTSETTQIENYIPTISFELPRDNQGGSGEAKVANPAGVNNWLLDVSDHELKIEAGIKTAAGTYEFVEFNKFFLKSCQEETEGAASRISMNIGDLWSRLELPFKDTLNFVGKLDWKDFSKGKRNKAFNYYFKSDTDPSVGDAHRLSTSGLVLYTGWRGTNFDMTIIFRDFADVPSLISRYKDDNNYIRWDFKGNYAELYEIEGGDEDFVRSWGINRTDPLTVRLVQKWNFYQLYVNGTLIEDEGHAWFNSSPGYVGFKCAGDYKVENFHLEDWEYDFTIADLIKTALAHADFHDVVVSGATEKAFAVIWGPQTDVPSPAEALRQLVGGLKLQLAYRGGVITVGKFNDRVVTATLQNTIFSTEEESEERRHLNVAVVDGNEHFWIYIDKDRLLSHDLQVLEYFDLPELPTLAAVQQRAQEEITNSNKGPQPGGSALLLFDLWRMDHIRWINNLGVSRVVRVEGFNVDIDQSVKPHQRMSLDTAEAVLDLVQNMTGIESAEAFGTATIVRKGVIYPSSIGSSEAVGTPTV